MSKDTTNGTIDLISTYTLGSVTLGSTDPVAIANATDLDNSGQITDEDRVLYSYNNAVQTIVTECVNVSGIETVDGTNVISIRSVGNTDFKYTSNGFTNNDNPRKLVKSIWLG